MHACVQNFIIFIHVELANIGRLEVSFPEMYTVIRILKWI